MNEANFKRFFSGSWTSYQLELKEDGLYQPIALEKNVKAEFLTVFDVIMEFFIADNLICFFLILDEKRRRARKEEKSVKFRVAISIEDSLLFCNRCIPNKYHQHFIDGLDIDDLQLYDLYGSHPGELLLMHRQAQNDTNLYIEQQMLKYSQEEIIHSEITNMIATKDMPIPIIRKLECDLMDIPLGPEDEKKDVRMGEVNVTITGSSIFDFYNKLVSAGVVYNVPLWLTASRSKGKTYRKIHYS